MEGINVVFSSEKVRGEMLPLTEEQKAKPGDFGVVDHFRIRVLPVLGTMPALFGQTMAAFVLCELAQQPFQPVSVAGLSRAVKHKLQQHLRNREQRVHNFSVGTSFDLTLEDVETVVREVWGCRCAVTGEKMGKCK